MARPTATAAGARHFGLFLVPVPAFLLLLLLLLLVVRTLAAVPLRVAPVVLVEQVPVARLSHAQEPADQLAYGRAPRPPRQQGGATRRLARSGAVAGRCAAGRGQ